MSAEEARLIRRLFDHLPAMVAFWDQDRRNVVANDAYLEWFGWTPEQLRGRQISELMGPELYARNEPYIDAVLAGEEQLFERTLVDTYGRTRHTQASYVPEVVDGEVVGFFVLVTDVTPRVEAREALAEANAELAEKHRLMTDVVDMVAHDLRTPATAVTGFLELAEEEWDDAPPERLRAYLERALGAGHRLADLLTDLLAMVNVDSARLVTRPERVPLAGAAEQARQHLPLDRDVRLAVPADLAAFADASQLQQVLGNLLGNALRYGAEPVSISAAPAGQAVQIRVSDAGPGVPDELVPRLFDRFTRAEGAPSAGGSGLGLYIARRLCEANGGSLRYEPAGGGGACFVVTLPCG